MTVGAVRERLMYIQHGKEGDGVKKAITFWVKDDVDVVALCGTLMLKRVENIGKDYGADGAQMFNFSPKDLKSEFFCPIKGNMKEVRDGKAVEE